MATTVYEKTTLEFMDGSTIEMRPLKISILREFMTKFDTVVSAVSDNVESMDILVECAMIAMKQYRPDLSTDKEMFEDIADMKMVYKIIYAASGIQLDAEGNESAVETAMESLGAN
jgi:hypothetical protein